MAEILTSGATEILNKLAGVVAQEINSAWGVKDDLKKLEETLQMILAVIADAERRQVTDEAVKLWLRWLKNVAYDADDVMDEFAYESMRRCERGDRLKHKVLDFVSSSNPLAFRFKMARKIRDINKNLDEITKKMHDFGLQISTQINTTSGESNKEPSQQTTSVSSEPDIVGREEDKNSLINILTKVTPSTTSSERNPQNVSVVSVVGMGGLGKTTLAQLIYRDELLKTQFELRMWVHVSEHFDVESLLIKIMESATNAKFDRLSNFDVLVKKVQESLKGKKYLLVLDDVWNQDQVQWDRLISVLLGGAPGSKVLVTTRNDQVATIVSAGTSPPYTLKPLSDDACWCMIENRAFSHGGALSTQEMTNIGKEIAKKCGGLPLAAKFLGSLLHSKNQKSDWILIRDDDIWNTQDAQRRILSILKLSYNNLPSHLKQCFSFCAIFPKNWEIEKEMLVRMWMAEGFLKPENKRLMEDIGSEYFDCLMWSSFFIYPRKTNLGDVETCKMHDLVHDLAEDVFGGNELLSLKVGELKDVSGVRRVELNSDGDISTAFLKSLSNAQKLRSIFVPEGSNIDPTVFSRNKHLRLLHVGNSGYFATLKLPHLRLKLRQLRYLHLATLNFNKVVNDRSISKLYNLETLVLIRVVGIQNLFTNIQSLKKLRHLDISYSHMEKLPDSVASLCNLQGLNLRGCTLKSLPDSVTGLKLLRFLNIAYNPIVEVPAFVTTLSNLEILDVSDSSKLKTIPESVTSLSNLKVFNFKYCSSLEALPEDFGALTQLRYLNLEGTKIKVLPDSCADLINLELLNLSMCKFPRDAINLKKLRQFTYYSEETPRGIGELVYLQALKYSVGTEEGKSIAELGKLDLLEELTINGLQNVRRPTDAMSVNLKGKRNLRELSLHWGQFEDRDQNARLLLEALQPPIGLRVLAVGGYKGEMSFPTWMSDPSCLPNLVRLILWGWGCSLVKLPATIGQLPSLRFLLLNNLEMSSLDIEFPLLTQLDLHNMSHLKEVCCSYNCLQSLVIRHCSSLIGIPRFPSLKSLDLSGIINHGLIRSISGSCTSLTNIMIWSARDFEFLPLSILQNNRNLKRLAIYDCNQFQGFRENAYDDGDEYDQVTRLCPKFQHDFIKIFYVRDCPVLKYLPDLRGWNSLEDLTICNCPQVKESLTYDLKSLSSVQVLKVDFIQREERGGDLPHEEDLVNLLE